MNVGNRRAALWRYSGHGCSTGASGSILRQVASATLEGASKPQDPPETAEKWFPRPESIPQSTPGPILVWGCAEGMQGSLRRRREVHCVADLVRTDHAAIHQPFSNHMKGLPLVSDEMDRMMQRRFVHENRRCCPMKCPRKSPRKRCPKRYSLFLGCLSAPSLAEGLQALVERILALLPPRVGVHFGASQMMLF